MRICQGGKIKKIIKRGGDVADKLTPKQQRFVSEYLIDLNATQAAIRAGYSKKTASVIGLETLRKPLVAAEIEKAIKQREDRTGITADDVLKALAEIGYGMGEKTTDRLKALELIGKHLGLFSGEKPAADEGVQIIDDV